VTDGHTDSSFPKPFKKSLTHLPLGKWRKNKLKRAKAGEHWLLNIEVHP
jgi:hypothetical protein